MHTYKAARNMMKQLEIVVSKDSEVVIKSNSIGTDFAIGH